MSNPTHDKATARPWKVGVHYQEEIWSADGAYRVAECFPTANGTIEANAALIVEAVNQHDALKQENERLKAELLEIRKAHGACACVFCTNSRFDVAKLRAALGGGM